MTNEPLATKIEEIILSAESESLEFGEKTKISATIISDGTTKIFWKMKDKGSKLAVLSKESSNLINSKTNIWLYNTNYTDKTQVVIVNAIAGGKSADISIVMHPKEKTDSSKNITNINTSKKNGSTLIKNNQVSLYATKKYLTAKDKKTTIKLNTSEKTGIVRWRIKKGQAYASIISYTNIFNGKSSAELRIRNISKTRKSIIIEAKTNEGTAFIEIIVGPLAST